MSNIVGKMWFSPGHMIGNQCIGVVLLKNEYGEYESYIGVGDGLDEDTDVKSIAEWGSTFPLAAAKAFFPEHL